MSTIEQRVFPLTTVKPDKIYGSSILRVASNFSKVRDDLKILQLADIFQEHAELSAVGVVDADDAVTGIISRQNLFSLLGKPYGRDILNKKTVYEITELVPFYDGHMNLFAIADELGDGMQSDLQRFYVLVNKDRGFQGIFSSHDLVRYLSHMTQEDIGMASMLQERLVKEHEMVKGRGWSLSAWSHYAKGVGGDFYFYRKLPGDKEFFTLCDVSGKGVAASIISSMVWGMLRMFDFRRGLRDLVCALNESIITTFQLEKYLTGIFLIYDPATRKLLSADMGHSHALIIRKGKVVALRGTRPNMPVGIETKLDPQLFTFSLDRGDRVLVYSDGITEQENPEGEEFSEKRLIGITKRCIEKDNDVVTAIPEAIREFRSSAPQQDDMSFIFFSVEE